MDIYLIPGIITFIITIILALVIIPVLKKLKIGQVERILGPKSHLGKEGTPTMGGIVMVLAITITLFVASFKFNILLLPALTILGFGMVGFIDDRKKLVEHSTDGISAKLKMILLFVISALFILGYIFVFKLEFNMLVPFVSSPINVSASIFVLLEMFILLGSTNAVNLTDGLDGLASGIIAIVMTFFTLIAIKNGDSAMVILSSSILGASLGFLIFNVKPAKVFMGDTGSLALGGAVAVTSIIMQMPLYLAIVLLIPVIETLSVALQVTYFKITHGKRIFKMAPLHHHLELSGMSEGKVVLLFWSITLVVCILAYFI